MTKVEIFVYLANPIKSASILITHPTYGFVRKDAYILQSWPTPGYIVSVYNRSIYYIAAQKEGAL